MTISYFEEIKALHEADETQDNVKKRLIDIGIFELFAPAWEKYSPTDLFDKVVYFTAYAFSWESKLIIIGQDPKVYRQVIAKTIKLPKEITEQLVNFDDTTITLMFQSYLNLYQNNLDFTQLESYKMLYKNVMDDVNNYDPDKKNDADYLDEKIKRMEKAEKMLNYIKNYEAKIKKEYKSILLPGQELEESIAKVENFQINSLKIEESPSIIKKD